MTINLKKLSFLSKIKIENETKTNAELEKIVGVMDELSAADITCEPLFSVSDLFLNEAPTREDVIVPEVHNVMLNASKVEDGLIIVPKVL